MSFIRTFNGDINPDELGFTYSHEHIVCIPPYWKEKNEEDLLLDDETNRYKMFWILRKLVARL
ncbi:hypothetical protein [Thermoanaerobacter thermocopriae]|nr:hypothetical protein [Thermoanaerobacter thermocopriae]